MAPASRGTASPSASERPDAAAMALTERRVGATTTARADVAGGIEAVAAAAAAVADAEGRCAPVG
ncbi:hypothetical protein ACP70R_040094 [Stipagrostis hirtigluma subsp. patula]